jgi:SRSO17 transposase
MTTEQIQVLGPAFADYLETFLFGCNYTQTFHLLNVYCRGLLSDLKRKTCEPIALFSGVAVRTLQEFLRDHGWSFTKVRELLQRRVAGFLPTLPHDGLGSLGIIDETATVKDGTKTPGVQRQYCGEVGKKENCIVTVHLGVARGHYKTLVDADLFLPEAWDQDRTRCQEACIPEELHYRPKWQIALEQLDRARTNGLRCDWLTFDENYGSRPDFLVGLRQRRQPFVGEVPKSFRCFTRRPRPGEAGHRADQLVRHSPDFTQQRWRPFRLQRQTLGEQEWEAKLGWVWLSRRRQPTARQYGLIWARNRCTGEQKYFVCYAPPRTSLRRQLQVAFGRWNIEHTIRVSKSEVGFRHFEGRSYVALMRHLVLCLVTLTFVAEQAERLRKKKSRGDDGTGMWGFERIVHRLVGGAAWDGTCAIQGGSESVLPSTEPCGPPVASTARSRLTEGASSNGNEDTASLSPTKTTSGTT